MCVDVQFCSFAALVMPMGGASAYGSLFVIMPRAELWRHTVIKDRRDYVTGIGDS